MPAGQHRRVCCALLREANPGIRAAPIGRAHQRSHARKVPCRLAYQARGVRSVSSRTSARTRRQGFELAGHTQYGPLGIGVSYSYINATYRSAWTEQSASNSSADAEGNINVKSGDRIPGAPSGCGSTTALHRSGRSAPTWSGMAASMRVATRTIPTRTASSQATSWPIWTPRIRWPSNCRSSPP